MTIIFPSNTKEIIDEIRGTIGRDVDIYYTLSGVTCSACDIDTVTGRSLDPFCPVCSGEGIVDDTLQVTVSAHVLWNTVNTSQRMPGGRIFTGDCKATVEYTDDIVTIIEASDYFLVDDRKLYLVDYDLRGVKNINRVAINLKQDPRDGR